MNQFAWYFSCNVGEASNPGPDMSTVRLAVVNPTAVYGKIDQMLALEADVIAISETSATSVVQKDCSRKLTKHGYKSFWSRPVAAKKSTLDLRPSYRGEAVGSAVFSKLPSRSTRGEIHESLWETQRFSTCIIRLGCMEVLMISVYGFANRYKEGIRPNDVLIASLIPVISQIGLPYIVAGDFNEPLSKLPSYKFFSDQGAVEAFQWYKSKFQEELPPTCCNSTRNDTLFAHPTVAALFHNMRVSEEHKFDIHTPLLVDFKTLGVHEEQTLWRCPKSWACFAPPSDTIDKHYQSFCLDDTFDTSQQLSIGQVEQAFQEWSRNVENAVDRALQESHVADPLKFPQKCLHQTFKGRCGAKKFRKVDAKTSVKSDRHGGFTPADEVFHLNTKLKVRQVRRIKSLVRRLKGLPLHPEDDPLCRDSLHAAKLEWSAILKAKGYGASWGKWILSFEAMPFVSLDLPEIHDLHMAEQITEHDCVHACRAEAKARSDRFKSHLVIDQNDDFCKTSYKLVRAKQAETLSEVPVCWTFNANLLRSRIGRTALLVQKHRSIPEHAKLKFGDADIEFLEQDGPRVFFRHLGGPLPVSGVLSVTFTAITPSEIANEFADFWSPMWLRDERHEQFEPDSWQSFDALLSEADLPVIPEIQYPFDDIELWWKIVRKLPSSKAVGPCGWSNDELKCLPKRCIGDLAHIFRAVSLTGFGPGMMMAKTVLLSKVPLPLSMHHARPITILSCLYRLYGKFIFKVTAQHWKDHFPYEVSGGLPGRGVKELAFLQKRIIERALMSGTCVGGFSLDLIKAYNTFGRYAIGRIMVRLGMPAFLVQAWIRSLDVMMRYPTIQGNVSSGIASTTGVPEGCSISVLSMLATSCLFHAWLKTEVIRPFAYADNWSWMSSRQKSHFLAYQQVLRLTSVMRLSNDHSKSWHWGTKKDFREACKQCALFHPAGEVTPVIKTSVKDLGEKVNYDKSVSLGFIKEKIDEAVTRMHKLEWLPATLQVKSKMLQSCVWPLALYSSDTTYIGMQHYTALRRAAMSCLVGKWHNASPVIACTFLSRHMIDPLLHTVLQCLRIVRRLASVRIDLARETVSDALQWEGSRPFGPATALRQYLKQLGWTLQQDGLVTGPDYLHFNLFHDSCRRITRIAKIMWSQHMLHLSDRKGFGDFLPDVALFHSVFHKLSQENQQILKLNVVGAFQTAAQKSKWDDDAVDECELCGASDTRAHRLLECMPLQEVRAESLDACSNLQGPRPEWIYLPIPRCHDDLTAFRAFVNSVKVPEVVAPRNCDLSRMRFFTDGGARYPRYCDARIATWAVVQDISLDELQMKQAADYMFLNPPQFPKFHVSAIGIVPGEQTVARAELFAILHALKQVNLCEPIPCVEFVTDASYVCKVIRIIEQGVFQHVLHKFSNGDIVQEIASLWCAEKFTVTKVKSHRQLESAKDLWDLWFIAGNMCADAAATMAYNSIPHEIRKLADDIVSHIEKEKKMLTIHFEFLVNFNKARCRLIDEKKKDTAQNSLIRPRAVQIGNGGLFNGLLMGADACEALIKFAREDYIPMPSFDIDDSSLHACLQGANIAKAFLLWSRLLRWPDGLQEDYDMKTTGDWGVSWLELLFSFYLSTGYRCPIKLEGAGAQAKYIDYDDPQALLLPDNKRSVSLQILCFRNLWQNITTLVQKDVLPRFTSYKCFSVSRLGFKSPVAGVPCRPILPNQEMTMKLVWSYIQQLNGSVALHKPLVSKHLNVLCHFQPFVELEPRERWARNQAYMKRLRKMAHGGG